MTDFKSVVSYMILEPIPYEHKWALFEYLRAIFANTMKCCVTYTSNLIWKEIREVTNEV